VHDLALSVAATKYEAEATRRLVAVCRELQRAAGQQLF